MQEDLILDNYQMLGSVHPETASIKNILAFYGVKAPHSGKPFSEAMLLGIGGGLGSTYILWEMEKHGYPSIVLAFRNKANYGLKYLQNLCSRLGASSTSFALPAIRKWGRLMTDSKNAKAWPTVFSGGVGLYGTLRTVYEAIELIGTGGGALRGLYADFLEEADSVLDRGDLKATAVLYRALHERWSALAQAALPDAIADFKDTKELLDRRAAINLEQGSAGLDAIAPINDALHEIKSRLNPSFPVGESDTSLLLADIQSQIEGIYQAEKEALAALKMAVSELSAV